VGLEDHKDVHQQGEEVVRDRDEEEEESVNKVLSRRVCSPRGGRIRARNVRSLEKTTTAKRKKGEGFVLRSPQREARCRPSYLFKRI